MGEMGRYDTCAYTVEAKMVMTLREERLMCAERTSGTKKKVLHTYRRCIRKK